MDLEEAFNFYLKVAEEQAPDAQMAIGRAFYYGEGVEEDNIEAVKWLKLAAKEEVPKAEYLLGECYLKGFGVDLDKPKAITLLRRAASQNYEPAINMLFEAGYDIEESNEAEVNDKSQKVVKVLDDPISRARRVYSMTVEQPSALVGKKDADKVVQLGQRKAHKLDELMNVD